MSEAREEHSVLLTEVTHEDIRRIGIGEYRTEVAIIDIDPVLHRHIVGHLVAKHCSVELNPLMRVRTRHTELMLEGEVHVARPVEVRPRVFLEELRHPVLYIGTEAATHPEHREDNPRLSHLTSLADDGLLGILHIRLYALDLIVQFTDQRQ